MTLHEEYYKAYEKGGYSEVFKRVMELSPELQWSECELCDLRTPTDVDGDCAVCASPKGDTDENK